MKDIKVGDILYGMWHYSMHYPVWFRVTKVSAKTAKAERLCSRLAMATDGGYGQQGYEVPDEFRVAERKEHLIREDKHGLATGSKWDYFHLEKWYGQPIWADHMD